MWCHRLLRFIYADFSKTDKKMHNEGQPTAECLSMARQLPDTTQRQQKENYRILKKLHNPLTLLHTTWYNTLIA